MPSRLLLWVILAASGCTSTAVSGTSGNDPKAPRIEHSLALAADGDFAGYSPRDFPASGEALAPLPDRGRRLREAGSAGQGVVDFCAPAADDELLSAVMQHLQEALGGGCDGDVHLLDRADAPRANPRPGDPESPPEETRAPVFREAELRGATVLIEVRLLENRVDYLGYDLLWQLLDTALLLSFPPLHWWVGDERFALTQHVELTAYDVRDPTEVLLRKTLRGRAARSLSEFEHGYVLFNAIRAWGESPERFDGDGWRRVYELLLPATQRALHDKLLREFLPPLRAELEKDDRGAKHPRFQAVIVGQRGGEGRKAAARDAQRLHGLLLKQPGVVGEHIALLIDATPERVLETVRGLRVRTRSADHLLVYFAGQGRWTPVGPALMLAGDEELPLADLALELAAYNRSKTVAFLLDCSFLGARDSGDYLEQLSGDPWQVACAAARGERAGEYAGEGLLTRLVCRELEARESSEPKRLGEVLDAIADPYSSLARTVLGGSHTLFRAPRVVDEEQDLQVGIPSGREAEHGEDNAR